MDARQTYIEELESKILHLEGKLEQFEAVVSTLISETNYEYNTYHRDIVITALRLIGLDNTEIRLFFQGEIML